MEQRNQKTFFVFKINADAFEPGQQSLIFWNRIVLICRLYVTKQPEELRYH